MADRGDEPEAGGQPVEAVDEVHRVDDRHRQRQRQQDRRDLVEHDGADAADRDVEHAPRHAHGDQHAGRGDLAGELGQRVQTPPVVDQADRHDQPAGHDDGGHARRVHETPGQRGQLGRQQHRGHHADVHREATHPRGRLHVDVAVARVGDGPEPGGEHPHPAGGEVGDDRRGQADEGQLAQRDAGAAVGQREQRPPRGELYWTRPATTSRRTVLEAFAETRPRRQAVRRLGLDAEHVGDGRGGDRPLAAAPAAARR